jgi:hypothetical protein
MSRFIKILCFLLPIGAFAADLEFVGSLERVSPESILIRRADGTRINAPLPPKVPKTGVLASETISAQYTLADEVRITCKPMDPSHCAELKSIQFLRPPTPKEWALVLGSSKPAGPPQPELEHARQVNLDRAANMPNFVADETAKRYTSPRNSNPPVWKLVDMIEAEITFKGDKPTREHVRINGKPWNKPLIPGVNWTVEFGTEIKPVFDPECPTEVALEGRREALGKQLLAYVFTSPPDGCFGTARWGGKHYNAAVTGRVLVEDPGGSMIQYEEETIGYPKWFAVQSFQQTILWDSIKIGEASYLLPVSLDFFVGFDSGDEWRVNVEYKNHRRFEADTNVTFHP